MSREPYRPRTPAPLRPSQQTNLYSPPPTHPSRPAYSFLNDTPSKLLAPKEGGSVKIKVKAGVSPEARSRIGNSPAPGVGLGGLRPITPRPVKSRLGTATPTHLASSSHHGSRHLAGTPSALGSSMRRVMTPSESDESLSAYAAEADKGAMDAALEVQAEELNENETVLVSVRVRPANPAEQRKGEGESVWRTESLNPQTIKLDPRGAREDREWTFDRILDCEADNASAYAMSAKTHVRRAMEGYNALIFAYGQTASGKTHTLSGSPTAPGIIPLAIHDLFTQIRETPDREYVLQASYLELYNEALLDLLSPDGKELSLSEGRKKGEVVINGLTQVTVRTEGEVRKLLALGEENRKVGKTDWNARSSRSHCVFRIVIESQASRYAPSASGASTPSARLLSTDGMTRESTLSIIDLAGSERHTSSKERNAEGKHINQSLLTLKLVISKLADMASKRNITHVPYRDSKLTRLLQPSLSGDALISVICTLSPSPANLNESLSTLSFAQGLKRVVLRAQRKEALDPHALIQQYIEEIADLKLKLAMASDGSSGQGQKSESVKGNGDMEKRLEELKSMILSGAGMGKEGKRSDEVRPISPPRANAPTLGYDKSSTQLRESLHAAELKISQLEDQNIQLKYDLEARHVNPDERIMHLMDEVAGLKMIAEDYERNLLEPSRKVREDVEREWKGKVDKLEQQLETKQIWANSLDDRVRALTVENDKLRNRCTDAEQKVHLIIDWLNTTLSTPSDSQPGSYGISSSTVNGTMPHLSASASTMSIPELVVEAPPEDFGPSVSNGIGRTTLTLNAKMTREKFSHMDLASLSERFGSLGVRAQRGGVKMLREESVGDLNRWAEDETF